jgi:hypothetical protein
VYLSLKNGKDEVHDHCFKNLTGTVEWSQICLYRPLIKAKLYMGWNIDALLGMVIQGSIKITRDGFIWQEESYQPNKKI